MFYKFHLIESISQTSRNQALVACSKRGPPRNRSSRNSFTDRISCVSRHGGILYINVLANLSPPQFPATALPLSTHFQLFFKECLKPEQIHNNGSWKICTAILWLGIPSSDSRRSNCPILFFPVVVVLLHHPGHTSSSTISRLKLTVFCWKFITNRLPAACSATSSRLDKPIVNLHGKSIANRGSTSGYSASRLRIITNTSPEKTTPNPTK